MRKVSSEIETALQNTSVKMSARVTAYKSRIFFEENDLSGSLFDSSYSVTETSPLPESVAWNSTINKYVTVFVDIENKLSLCRSDGSPVHVKLDGAYITTDNVSRPGIYEDNIYYHDGDRWNVISIDMNSFLLDVEDCAVSKIAYPQTIQGAIYPVSATEQILFFLDEGAVGLVYVNDGIANKCPGRMFHPTVVLAEPDDFHILHFSGAAKLNDETFCYFTAYDGSVRVVKFSHGNWSDIFTAIPTDLSSFKVSNVFSTPTAIFLTGVFTRNAEFSSDATYTILSKSTDGYTFSLDRKTLVSVLSDRFISAFNGSSILFTSAGRSFEDVAHYQLIGESSPSIQLSSNLVSGNPTGYNITLSSGNEQYFENPYTKTGFFSKLEIGVWTGSEYEWILYHETIINSVSRGVKDGSRSMSINIVPDARWHTSAMTHPFYIEMIGKGGGYDDCTAMDGLYRLTGDSGVEWSFSTDLWSSEKINPDSTSDKDLWLVDGFGPKSHLAYHATTHATTDLTSKILKSYPVFGDLDYYKFKIYGWSRAGNPDTNPNTVDPTDTSSPNDSFYALLEVTDVNDRTYIITCGEEELSSSYSNPPQSYFVDGVRQGSYPVEFNIPNPGAGCKIKRVGVEVSSGPANTVYFIERIEMPELSAQYQSSSNISLSAEATSFQITTADTSKSSWALVDTFQIQVDSSNQIDGNKQFGTATLKNGYCYAIAIKGSVEFSRGGNRYIQDAEYFCSSSISDSPYIPPTWTRSYPPGVGPSSNPSVTVSSDDIPYYGNVVTDKTSVATKSVYDPSHIYIFNHSDERLLSSTISNEKIPYVYVGDNPIGVSLFLAGVGDIEEIVDGLFTVYIFESPEPITSFKFYGGQTPPEINAYFVTDEGGARYFDEGGVPSHLLSRAIVYERNRWPDNYENAIAKVRHDYDSATTFLVKYSMTLPDVPGYNRGFANMQMRLFVYNTVSNAVIRSYYFHNSVPGNFSWQGNVEIGVGETLGAEAWCQYFYASGDISSLPYYFDLEVIGSAGSLVPTNAQVPVPNSFILNLGAAGIVDGGVVENSKLNTSMETRQKGIPQLLFSTTPYSAFNFEETCRTFVSGEYSYAGLVGLAKDENNYLVGYFRPGHIGLMKVRGGTRETIFETSVGTNIEKNKLYDIRFWHRDGLFGIDVKNAQDQWGRRGSGLLGATVKWIAEFGSIAADDEIFHVGVYAFINPPKFRTVGFVSTSGSVPVLPCDINPVTGESDFINLFSESGKVDIDGIIYGYSSKNMLLHNALKEYMGPYQLRNLESWDSPYNNDKNGKSYQGGKAVEFTQFIWQNGVDHANDYTDSIVASSSGYNWLLDQSQWKVWITTGKAVVWLRNRARHYSEDIPDYYPDGDERIYITDGLSGLTQINGETTEYRHSHGAWVYIDSDDSVTIYGFSGYSGNHDQSIRSLLDKFCKIAGTSASFIGDKNILSQTIFGSQEIQL